MAVALAHNHSIVTSVWLVVIVLTSTVVRSVWGGCTNGKGFNCPRSCTCTAIKISCRESNLSQIPTELPSILGDLLLSNNQITRLNAGDLANCTTLSRLDLSFNRLTFIDESAFADTVALTFLDFSSNEIVVSELANNTFDSLKFLEELRMNNNSWPTDKHYHGRLFAELRNLTHLSLDGIPDHIFPAEFSKLENLQNLTITGGLNKITNETFLSFNDSFIIFLTILTGNNLIAVEPLSFAHFGQLRCLFLGGNHKLGFKSVANAWYGLQQTSIWFVGLSAITTESDGPQRITGDFFRYLNNTKIAVLDFSENNLIHIEPLFSANLKYLEEINFAKNRLYNPTALMADVAKLENLMYLSAGFQSCPSDSLAENGFQNSKTFDHDKIGKVMRYYQVRSEYYRTITCTSYEVQKKCKPPFSGQTAAQSVLSNTDGDDMSPICISLPRSIRYLDLSNALLVNQRTLPPLTITEGGGELNFLSLRSNGLTKINGPLIFTNPPKNLSVDLNLNQIGCIHPDMFKISHEKGARITQLLLEMNSLGLLLEQDTNGLTFQYYPFLEGLSLNYNAIKKLHNVTFRNQTKLQFLTLVGNSLQDIEFEFEHMRGLKLLDLSYNDITFLSKAKLEKLANAIERNNLSFSLLGNPLQCTCDTLSFLRWIDRYHNNLLGFEETTCFFSDRYVSFSRLADYILVELEYECNEEIAVIVSGVLLGLVLILVTLSAVCYRNRWEIRYAFIKLTQRGQRYQQLFAQLPHYDYDAFVVYDSEDRNWVNNELLPHLEQDTAARLSPEHSNSGQIQVNQGLHTGLRLCVHERDFRPGEDIIANIWNKMEKSRKVILVISNTFATSHYCDYELNLARMQSVEIGRNIIVPVLLDMPDIDRISEYLYWVLRKVTYLEWPQREEEQREFWRKLRRIIGDVDDDDDDDSY